VRDAIRRFLSGRPWWANALLLFCAYMTFIYLPYDLFVKPVERDEEVWFGIVLHGWAAKATGPLHWAIYAAGAYGFYHMRPWLWPWAAVYVAQIAVSMLVWSLLDERGNLIAGALAGGLFAWMAFGLWRARPLFRGRRPLAIANERI
jgi:hypothetical protein